MRQENLHKNAVSDEVVANPRWLANRGVYHLLQEAIERLDDPGSERDAMTVLNFFTLFIYKEKGAAWWKDRFEDSRFAGIIQGRS